MADRKQFQSSLTVDPELAELLQRAKNEPPSEEDLHEQRISFAFGNALETESITKDSVRESSKNIRLKK